MTTDLNLLEPLSGESPNAFQAFCDYVAMGYQRSLNKLVERYSQNPHESPTRQRKTLATWSRKFEWQRRLNDYQQMIAVQAQQGRIEAYNDHIEQALPMAQALLGSLNQMMADFQRLRTTRRQIIDDPRDLGLPPEQRRQIESIQMKVNVNDLQKLIAAYGQLNKDLRTSLGLPNVTEIQGMEPVVLKTYVGVSPDDWDTEQTPSLPATVQPTDEDPQEDFPD